MNKKNKKHLLKRMKIDEVSMVPKGMNQEAFVILTKIQSEEDEEKFCKATFNEALQAMGLSQKIEEWMQKFYDMNEALRVSVRSIICDPAIKEKKTAIMESLSQFQSAIVDAVTDTDVINGVKEAFSKLKKEESKKMDFEKELEKVQAELKKAQDSLADMNTYKTMAEMTDAEKEFYKGIADEDQKKDFLKKSSKDRLEEISKAKKDDESFEAHGITVQKSKIDPELFALLKAMNEENKDTKEKLSKAEQETEDMKLAKKAEDELPFFPGDTKKKMEVYKGLQGMPEETRKTAMDMLKKSNDIVKSMTDENGVSGTIEDASDLEKLDKMAKDLSEKDNIPFAKAYTKVLETKDGKAIYDSIQKKKTAKAA